MKAISPVIATVILVAVTIAVAIAVALWMSGMVGALTGIERLDIVEKYATANAQGWTVYLKVKNTGTRDTTITNVFINDKPITAYTNISVSANNTTYPENITARNITESIGAGKELYVAIRISKEAGFASGQMVTITLQSGSGGTYSATVILP